ncbi:MAG: sugar transferase [Verrucomicrobiae bacterium]|nr:sugar transferase [Verrucomicrobiae bacterium]
MSHSKSSKEATYLHFQNQPEPSKTAYNKLVALAFLGDGAVVWGSLLLAYWLRFQTNIANIGIADSDGRGLAGYFGHFIVGTILLLGILTNFRFYERRNFLSFQRTINIVGKSTLVWTVSFLALSLLLNFRPTLSRVYFGISFLSIVTILPAWRWMLWRMISHERFASRLRQRAIVIGWSEEFEKAYRIFRNSSDRPFEVCGFISPPGDDLPTERHDDLRVIGRYEDLPLLLKMQICDVVLVANMNNHTNELIQLSALCEKEMVEFKLVPTWFRVLLSGLHLESVSGMPVLGISKLPLHSALNQYLKRAVDIIGATVGLILAAPIIAAFGTLIYLESPGPIFYRQRRLGLGGKLFDMIKLRSMKLDAEQSGGPGWTVKDDPRCLRVGKFMRRWNIDEVPQFWNVLRGDMSLVGPRPERPELIQNFKEVIPHYNARHHIKPGITGWAQVNGLRGDTDLGERVRFDLHYIENWNVLFDFQIMLLTFFKRENAC